MSGADITLTLPSGRAATARSSDRLASLTDEEDSSGTGVHLSPTEGLGSQESSDHEYTDSVDDYEESWTQLSKVDLGPSESASRPSTFDQQQAAETSLRRQRGRQSPHVRIAHRPARPRRQQPSSPESVESNDELYGADLPLRQGRPYHHWAPPTGGQGHHYPAGYNNQTFGQYPPQLTMTGGQQLVPLTNQSAQYAYPPYQQHSHSNVHGYFGHAHPSMPNPIGNTLPPPNGTYGPSEIVHPAYYQYPAQHYQIPHAITSPSPVYQHYQPVYTPPPAPSNPTTPAAPADTAKDDNYAELKQMLLNDKADREAREAAAKKAEEEKLAALEAAKAKAEEIAKAAEAAAAAATTEAEKKAADEQAKLKAEAEEAANKAKAEADEAAAKFKEEKEAAVAAAAAAAVPPAPEERKKPIKFKDAVGRKFSFPFHLCRTWEGMEDLIRQAFVHVDVIGPHVAEGHYDLIGPNNEIILPGVWDTVIEPDWTVTMHMWPMPEPKTDEVVDVPAAAPEPPPDEKKKAGKKAAKRPTGFSLFGGGARSRPKSTKATKKT